MVTCTATLFSVGGDLIGLGAGKSVTIELNGGDDLTGDASGVFVFSTRLTRGTAYAVTLPTQPTPGQTCTVTNGTGTINAANVSNYGLTLQLKRRARATDGHDGRRSPISFRFARLAPRFFHAIAPAYAT